MYVTIANRKISTSLIAIGLMLLTLLLVIFFIVIFRVEDKTISFINFYEQPVKVSIKGVEYKVQPYDTKVITLNTSNSFDVRVEDESNSTLQNMRIENVKRSQQMVSIAVSPKNGYCFFSTKIDTDSVGNVVVKDKVIINDSPSNYSISDMNTLFSDYSYPGKTQKVDDRYSRVITYVYPISCNLINNDESVLSTISAFSEYNAADQLKYLQQVRDKVTQSNDILKLNSAIPTATNKYYISEDKYILIYE